MATLPRCLQLFGRVLYKEERLGGLLPKGFKRAAVLIPLFLRKNEWYLLFTRRTEHVRNHPGQISFPGGRLDESDENVVHTALRETYEEIGINEVQIIGSINDILTISQYIVTPFVGVVSEEDVKAKNINHNEIEYILEVPVSHLANPDHFTLRTREWQGNKFLVPFFYYKKEEIWGATGRILVDFLNRFFLLDKNCQSEIFGLFRWLPVELADQDLETLRKRGILEF
ncbi:MAG: NUDIX hydrolase [Candidatus Thorarchaeota archaeon]